MDAVDGLLRILAVAKAHKMGNPEAYNMFRTSNALLETIDSIPIGKLSWVSFHIDYTGPITPDTLFWKQTTYIVYSRNPLQVAETTASSSDFLQTWDYWPYKEYTSRDCRCFSHLMSGQWAFNKAVSFINLISSLPATTSAPTTISDSTSTKTLFASALVDLAPNRGAIRIEPCRFAQSSSDTHFKW